MKKNVFYFLSTVAFLSTSCVNTFSNSEGIAESLEAPGPVHPMAWFDTPTYGSHTFSHPTTLTFAPRSSSTKDFTFNLEEQKELTVTGLVFGENSHYKLVHPLHTSWFLVAQKMTSTTTYQDQRGPVSLKDKAHQEVILGEDGYLYTQDNDAKALKKGFFCPGFKRHRHKGDSSPYHAIISSPSQSYARLDCRAHETKNYPWLHAGSQPLMRSQRHCAMIPSKEEIKQNVTQWKKHCFSHAVTLSFAPLMDEDDTSLDMSKAEQHKVQRLAISRSGAHAIHPELSHLYVVSENQGQYKTVMTIAYLLRETQEGWERDPDVLQTACVMNEEGVFFHRHLRQHSTLEHDVMGTSSHFTLHREEGDTSPFVAVILDWEPIWRTSES